MCSSDLGPLFVIDVLDDVTYRVGEQNKKTWTVIHHDRLKKYHYEPGIDIPNGWVWSATKTRIKLPGKEVGTQYEAPREKPQKVTLADCQLALNSPLLNVTPCKRSVTIGRR